MGCAALRSACPVLTPNVIPRGCCAASGGDLRRLCRNGRDWATLSAAIDGFFSSGATTCQVAGCSMRGRAVPLSQAAKPSAEIVAAWLTRPSGERESIDVAPLLPTATYALDVSGATLRLTALRLLCPSCCACTEPNVPLKLFGEATGGKEGAEAAAAALETLAAQFGRLNGATADGGGDLLQKWCATAYALSVVAGKLPRLAVVGPQGGELGDPRAAESATELLSVFFAPATPTRKSAGGAITGKSSTKKQKQKQGSAQGSTKKAKKSKQ